jgi:hypothetical protein
VTSGRTWWIGGLALGVGFVFVNLVELAFVGGDVTRDLVGVALGCVMVAAAVARLRGWKGLQG